MSFWKLSSGFLVLAIGILGCSATSFAIEPGNAERGKVVYNDYCYKCHGIHGDGKGFVAGIAFPPPANFTDPNLWKGRPDSFFLDVITNGYANGRMPPWWDVISKQEILDVFAYIKTFRKK